MFPQILKIKMRARYIISALVSKTYSYIIPHLQAFKSKYPDIKLETFDDLNQFQNSDHWGRTDVLCMLFCSSSTLNESLRSNPLKWVHSFTSGVDAYMTPEFKSSPIPLTNSKGAYNDSLMEYVLASMLYFNKKFSILETQKSNKEYKPFLMPTLYGSTLVILGYGSIGKSIGKVGKSLGMKVIGVKRTATEPDEGADEIIETQRLHEVLPQADFLAMAMPNHPSAHNIMSMREFALMKKTAVLVNIGRGNSINEDDLANALNNDIIGGAALDVFKTEPLPLTSPLWTAKNLIISPHNADMVVDLAHLCVGCFENHLINFLSGKPFTSVVDKEKGY
ncbi:unnamed protein product [Blepharisma stoltei]|uniref:D-isomer specific 2-hydroxyacid dehydrogenase NAD-binding domain-containing protein n=1 Tax=Blepharisma stoltei TaxID=1481888 RepID=A0AAU9K4F5_9CILI|nr:unnamed protein product [Blepharisma stoltei]